MIGYRLGGAAAAGAGMLFAAYPMLRPYAAETTMAGAEAWASTAWTASHTFGMVAFILLVPVFLALRGQVLSAGGVASADTTPRAAGKGGPAGAEGAGRSRAADVTLVLAWVGTALVLPYYGAETFALGRAGEHAMVTGDIGVLAAIEEFRWEPLAMTMFGLGLLALAGAGVALVRVAWHDTGLLRIGGFLTSIGLGTYLVQFFLPAAGRIGHGLVLGAGLVILAVWLFRRGHSAGGHDQHDEAVDAGNEAAPRRAALTATPVLEGDVQTRRP